MPFDPCGRVVEFLRDTVEDTIRPFKDSSQEVRRVWYPVPWGTPMLGFPTAFTCANVEPFPWLQRNVGEVYPPAIKFKKKKTPAGLTFSRSCGTQEEFQIGTTYDPNREPVVRNADGIPICCGCEMCCAVLKCTTEQVNGKDAGQLREYPVGWKDATDPTPFVLSEVSLAGGGASPDQPQYRFEFKPAGKDGVTQYAELHTADEYGLPLSTVKRFEIDDENYQVETRDGSGLEQKVVKQNVETTLKLTTVVNDGWLTGTNLTIDPDLLPPAVYLRSQQTIDFATVTPGTFAEIVGTNVRLMGTHAGTRRARLPAVSGAVIWITGGGSGSSQVSLYPPTGERVNGNTINTPMILDNVAASVGHWVAVRYDPAPTFAGFYWVVTFIPIS